MSGLSLNAHVATSGRRRPPVPALEPVDPVVREQVDRIYNALMGRRWVASPNGRNLLLVEPDGSIVGVRARGGGPR